MFTILLVYSNSVDVGRVTSTHLLSLIRCHVLSVPIILSRIAGIGTDVGLLMLGRVDGSARDTGSMGEHDTIVY